ncbi:MAG: hypothetical protein K0U93_03295 [Gammaproteobacteria bacterium]|nr:hypothetical protein [Gammaproteobacteria bacterium]
MTVSFEWPASHRFSRDAERAAERQSRDAVAQWLSDAQIDPSVNALLADLYVPMAAWLTQLREQRSEPLVVGICGGQGSGKSTISALVKLVLAHGFGQRAVAWSIDDIYKTHEARAAMAESVHPLFATRGVPGTHDIDLGVDLLEALIGLEAGQSVGVPTFDKALDTRADESQWPTCEGPLDIIIVEGWCVGAVAQTQEALREPTNVLEADEDATGNWRREVNRALRDDYPRLFGRLDLLMLLAVSGMERVFEWRRLQEAKLRASLATRADEGVPLRTMTDEQVDRFVMHYERITRHILAEMPARADAVMPIDESHNPASIRFKR